MNASLHLSLQRQHWSQWIREFVFIFRVQSADESIEWTHTSTYRYSGYNNLNSAEISAHFRVQSGDKLKNNVYHLFNATWFISIFSNMFRWTVLAQIEGNLPATCNAPVNIFRIWLGSGNLRHQKSLYFIVRRLFLRKQWPYQSIFSEISVFIH